MVAEPDPRLLTEAMAAAANAVVITDADGIIEFVNPAFTRITGYEPEDAVGRNPRDLLRSGVHDETFYRGLWTTILAGEVWRGRVVNRRRDGSRYVADQTITPVPTEDGSVHFISIHEDVTARVAAEDDLGERVKELRVLYHGTRALYDADAAFEERLQRVVDILPQASPYPEITEASFTVRDTTVTTPSFRRTPWMLSAEIVLEDAVIGSLELALREERPERDAGPFLEEERDLLEILAQAVSETLQRQRLDVISQEVSDVTYILNTDGVVRFATPSVEKATGYTREEFEGMRAVELVHEDDRPGVQARFDALAGSVGEAVRTEYRFVTRGGEVRHVESVARNLVDHPGVGGILITSRDVTERIEMEERMRESQRIEAIGRLAGGVAHDFNNLLTVIRSQTDLLLLDCDPRDLMVAEVEVIQAATDRAATLTNQLLAFSRDQVLRPGVVRLCDVVRDTLELVRRAIGEDVRIEMDLPGDRSTVEVDPGQLGQVVLNLAVNARAAMPEGGVLGFRTSKEVVDERTARERGDSAPGVYTVLEVSDTGEGMDEATRSRVFEPFFSTKGKLGTGLGLAQAYGFVTQSGGSIGVESAPGAGTTFFLRFPAVDREPDVVATPNPRPEESRVSGTVLVVEDDFSVRRAVTRILQRAGLDVVPAEDAEEALSLIGSGRRADVVLSDLGLTGMSGGALAARLRETHPRTPFIVMSGYAADSPGRVGRLPADIPFIQKPFIPDTLIRVVRRALATALTSEMADEGEMP